MYSNFLIFNFYNNNFNNNNNNFNNIVIFFFFFNTLAFIKTIKTNVLKDFYKKKFYNLIYKNFKINIFLY